MAKNAIDWVNKTLVAPVVLAGASACSDRLPEPPVKKGVEIKTEYAACNATINPADMGSDGVALFACGQNAFPLRDMLAYQQKHDAKLLPKHGLKQPLTTLRLKNTSAPDLAQSLDTSAPRNNAGELIVEMSDVRSLAQSLKAKGVDNAMVVLSEYSDATKDVFLKDLPVQQGTVVQKIRAEGVTIFGYKDEQGSPVLVLPVEALKKNHTKIAAAAAQLQKQMSEPARGGSR